VAVRPFCSILKAFLNLQILYIKELGCYEQQLIKELNNGGKIK